jgi:hypothetical protein
MPSKSKAQHKLMMAVAHSPEFAKKVGIKQSVGKDFADADKGRKFGIGGSANITHGGKGQINKQITRAGSIYGQQKEVPNISLNKYIGKKEGGVMKHDDIKEDKKLIKKAFGMHDKQLHESKKTDLSKLKKGGMTMDKEPRRPVKGEHAVQKQAKRGAEIIKMAKGGLASGHKSADGCAVRGKTRAMAPAMCGGGMAKKK